jgi:APA family basic amino acid/polyamine antiporter
MEDAGRHTLTRTLRLREVIVIVVGTVIGSGIFIVPATVLRQTGGDAGVAMIVWVLAGILSLLGALTYGELAAMKPEAGGLYVFMRDAFGSFPAFLYGWTLFFVIASGSIAALAAAFTGYLGQLIDLSPAGAKLAAVAMIAAVTVVNVAGTRSSASVQTWTTAFKVGALVLMSVALLAAGRVSGADAPALVPDAASTGLLSGAGIALIAVLWAYEGWQYATFSVGETLEPQRTFPLGIAIGTAVLILVYCLANIGYLAALSPATAAASTGIAADAVGAAFGPGAARLIAVAILVSIFSAANGIALTAPRVFYAMARDGVFFRRLALVHPRFGTPAVAIVTMSAWAMLLALTGTFDQLLTYVVFTGWIFYALGAASIFSYRRRLPDAHRPFRVPGYPLTPLLFVLAAAAIVANAVATQTGRALVGLVVVLTGVPAYLVWRARRPVVPASGPGSAGAHTGDAPTTDDSREAW